MKTNAPPKSIDDQAAERPANQEKHKAQKLIAQLKRQSLHNLKKSEKLVADIEQLIIKLGRKP